MRNNLSKKWLVVCIAILLFWTIFGSAVNAIKTENKEVANTIDDNNHMSITLDGYTDILVQEAWDMLNDPSPSNGIQIPIDVRTYSEWYGERIDTPYPEDPRHYCLSDLQNENGLQEFISLYNGSEVILSCKSGGRSASAANILVNSEFNGTIYNMVGGITAWKGAGLPTKLGNEPPYQPDEPSGPPAGITEYLYWFSTSTVDPDDDAVKYGWDWNGDDIVDDWTSYHPSATPVNISHSWTVAGTYDVKVIAEDNVGDQSDFSLVLTVTVVVNTPPDAPDITGPANGKVGEECEYIFVTTDIDGDDVSYYVEWGDGLVEEWTEYYESGGEFTVGHTWDEKGTYTIRAKTKDIHDAESDWATLKVSMPKNKAVNPLKR
jgi:rhodanese-related sulfurtransferase